MRGTVAGDAAGKVFWCQIIIDFMSCQIIWTLLRGGVRTGIEPWTVVRLASLEGSEFGNSTDTRLLQ